MKSTSYVKAHGNSCTITVDASPGASRTEIVGISPWRSALQIRIAAEAKDGEANAELLRFLSKRLSVPVNSLKLIRGARTSMKVIHLPIPADKACELLGGD